MSQLIVSPEEKTLTLNPLTLKPKSVPQAFRPVPGKGSRESAECQHVIIFHRLRIGFIWSYVPVNKKIINVHILCVIFMVKQCRGHPYYLWVSKERRTHLHLNQMHSKNSMAANPVSCYWLSIGEIHKRTSQFRCHQVI